MSTTSHTSMPPALAAEDRTAGGVPVEGDAFKFGKAIPRWYGALRFDPGCMDGWLADLDAGTADALPLAFDHTESALEMIAGTGNGTLRFAKRRLGDGEWLTFAAEIMLGTRAQADAVELIRQRLLTEVSVGILMPGHRWEFPEEFDVDEDTLVCTEGRLFELSGVTRGGMGADGSIRESRAAASSLSAVDAVPARTRLHLGPMRELAENAAGDVTAFDVGASRAAARAELAARQTAAAGMLVSTAGVYDPIDTRGV